MALIINWRGSDELIGGSAKAPTDTGLPSGNPAARDAHGRQHLEIREINVGFSAEDPCLWLRKSDNTLAKFRPASGLAVVDHASDLPAAGSAAAKALQSGDAFLVRFAADGVTREHRLVVWDAAAAAFIWDVSPQNYLRALVSAADVAAAGPAGHHLQDGDVQYTIEPGREGLKVYHAGNWLEVFSWDRLRNNFATNHWAGRIIDLPVPQPGVTVADGSAYMVELDVDGAPLNRMFVWRETAAEITTGTTVTPQQGEWRVVDQAVWVKQRAADPDNRTDAHDGDLTVTLEVEKESLKVYDGKAGAWVTIPATDSQTVRRWIASLSLFQGTVVELGGSLPGAIDFAALPDLSDPTLVSLKSLSAHYWIFVGASGTAITAADPHGLGRDVLNARLNPGDWLMISNRSTDPTKVDAHWVVVSGDLLSASRARALYSHDTWRPGNYEAGTVIVHDKALWRSISAVTVSDGAPVDGVNVAQVAVVDVTAPAGQATGVAYTVTVNGVAVSVATLTVGEQASLITGRLIFALEADPRITAAVKVEAGLMAGVVADPANVQIKLTARVPGVPFTVGVSSTSLVVSQTTANVTVSPWEKVDLAAGVRWVPTDAERDAISNSPRQDIIYVLSSAAAHGKGALYYYDNGAKKWMPLGGETGEPLDLSGGEQLLSIGVPVGTMVMWPGATAPRGWRLCDGSSFTAAALPELAKVLPGLKLPDMRGAYPRGAGLNGNGGWGSASNAVLGWQEDSTARPKTGFTGTAATAGSHSHNLQMQATSGTQELTFWGRVSASASPDTTTHWQADGGSTNAAGNHTHTVAIDGGGDSETRPKTIFLNFIIKVDDSAVIAVTP